MNWYNSSYRRVLLDDLIAFAWSAPMRDLAKQLDISDVGLRKQLRGYGVTLPPQGHWNRVHAGQKVPSPPKAPPRMPGQTGRVLIEGRLCDLIGEAPPFPIEGPFASSRVPEDLAELREQERKAIGRIAAPRSFADVHQPGVSHILQAEEKRRRKAAESRWHHDPPRFFGPFYQRQLRLFCGLFRGLEQRGHSGHVDDNNGQLQARLRIGDTGLRLGIEVKGKHATEQLSGYRRPAADLPATTPMRLRLPDKLRLDLPHSWEDQENNRLEAQLADIVADLIVAGEAAFRQSLVEEQEWLEEERRRKEEARRQRLAELEAERF
jgi:hypothetical protein